mmetsp:Transcript_18040/g.38510  ORF Transcript_18040/g.38510 Transcript_18040/m.38510 type:complete len:215 (+) Transcript_18040:1910-2554(+)
MATRSLCRGFRKQRRRRRWRGMSRAKRALAALGTRWTPVTFSAASSAALAAPSPAPTPRREPGLMVAAAAAAEALAMASPAIASTTMTWQCLLPNLAGLLPLLGMATLARATALRKAPSRRARTLAPCTRAVRRPGQDPTMSAPFVVPLTVSRSAESGRAFGECRSRPIGRSIFLQVALWRAEAPRLFEQKTQSFPASCEGLANAAQQFSISRA